MPRRKGHGVRTIAVIPTLCAALMVSACGSSATHETGQQLFAQNCGRCHTLAAARTGGTVGPDLDRLFAGKPATAIESVVRHQIATGGGGMPSGIVSDGAAAKIATYVASVIR